MGMSASQVRLLTITKRIHEVENEAERIQNQKMLLGLQSDEAYEEYLAAMEKKNVQVSLFDGNTGDFYWDDLSINQLYSLPGMNYRLKVKNLTGVSARNMAVTEGAAGTTAITFTHLEGNVNSDGTTWTYTAIASTNGQRVTITDQGTANQTQFLLGGVTLTFNNGTASSSAFETHNYTVVDPDGVPHTVNNVPDITGYVSSIQYNNHTYEAELVNGIVTFTSPDGGADWVECETVPEVCAYLGITDPHALEDATVFRDLVYNAYAIIESKLYDEDIDDYRWKETSVATNTGLREASNKEQLALAEANYEAALRKIDKKEEQYDKELAKMDQERKALTTQLDTLKTCIKENIDRTFKIFQG